MKIEPTNGKQIRLNDSRVTHNRLAIGYWLLGIAWYA
jgi:hypothetical protein